MDVQTIIDKLGLVPHPAEGGYFVETYRSAESIAASALDPRYGRDKAISTAIYYMLTANTFSAMHRLQSDEIFHFYAGDPVEMLQIHPDGSHEIVIIGNDIETGLIPQMIVRANVWQGSRLVEGGTYALLGTTVAPAFDYEDYETGDRDALIRDYPDCAEWIRRLTR